MERKKSKIVCSVEGEKARSQNSVFKIQFLFKIYSYSKNRGMLRDERLFFKICQKLLVSLRDLLFYKAVDVYKAVT